FAGTVRRVVLLGPSHFVGFRGLAVPDGDTTAFVSPLGDIPLDAGGLAVASALPEVVASDAAPAEEHSLEGRLPCLQPALGPSALVPIAVGTASAEAVARVLDALWGGEETLVVVSSDLSHYLPYEAAVAADAATRDAIERLDWQAVGDER